MNAAPTRRFVVGIDESDECVDALRWAVSEAMLTKATLDIVGVWDVEPVNVGLEQAIISAPHGQPAERLARIEQVIEWVQPGRDGVEFTVEVLAGDTAHALVERAEGAALLILGRHHRRGIPFASHTVSHVMKHATCPVVLVPSRAEVLASGGQ